MQIMTVGEWLQPRGLYSANPSVSLVQQLPADEVGNLPSHVALGRTGSRTCNRGTYVSVSPTTLMMHCIIHVNTARSASVMMHGICLGLNPRRYAWHNESGSGSIALGVSHCM